MSNTKKTFQSISNEDRNYIIEGMIQKIKNSFQKEELEDGYFAYESEIQEVKFRCYMTDEDIENTVKLSVDVLEELKCINNENFDKDKLNALMCETKNAGQNEGEFRRLCCIWEKIKTDRLTMLLWEADNIRRVGGVYAAFISNPLFQSAVYAVFERIVDDFDNDELWLCCLFFLVRAVMKMRSENIETNYNS